MEKNKVTIIELIISLLFVVTGLLVWWWSQQLVWILIFPPPLEQQLIEIIPFICWGLGILLILDALRRNIRKSNNVVEM
jgi:hypothetical protein